MITAIIPAIKPIGKQFVHHLEYSITFSKVFLNYNDMGNVEKRTEEKDTGDGENDQLELIHDNRHHSGNQTNKVSICSSSRFLHHFFKNISELKHIFNKEKTKSLRHTRH
ncbi:hypothetical protein Dimus_026524 [Dionaea muscipula]